MNDFERLKDILDRACVGYGTCGKDLTITLSGGTVFKFRADLSLDVIWENGEDY